MQPCVDAGMDADICFEKFPDLRGAGDLVNHFHLALVQAAKTRKTSVTRLKVPCRDCGVLRWPYRKLQKGKPKCDTSGETVPVVESMDGCSCTLDEYLSCVVVPKTQELHWWMDQWILKMLADSPPGNITQDPPRPSPVNRPTLPAAQTCPFFFRPPRRPPPPCEPDAPPTSPPQPDSACSFCLHHAMAGHALWHNGVIL